VPRDLPIVGLTASVLDDDRERCRDAGMDGALAKPLQRTALAEVLAEWVPRQAA
jgi:CheY-like chemotaxis protein